MRIAVNGRNLTISPTDRALLVRRAGFALSQFRERVRQVSLTVSDDNGHRGGVDKSCRVLVRVAPLGDLVAEGRGETAETAAGVALEKAARLVSRGLGRIVGRRKGRTSMAGESVPRAKNHRSDGSPEATDDT